MTENTLSTGNLREYWAKSSVSNRSGIGITRKGRRKLQRLISNFEREHNPSVVKAVEDILGRYNRRDGDLFRSVMEYLNNYNTQDHVTRNAEALTEAFVDFIIQIRADAADIAAEIDARN